jgi:hypothetical protein
MGMLASCKLISSPAEFWASGCWHIQKQKRSPGAAKILWKGATMWHAGKQLRGWHSVTSNVSHSESARGMTASLKQSHVAILWK